MRVHVMRCGPGLWSVLLLLCCHAALAQDGPALEEARRFDLRRTWQGLRLSPYDNLQAVPFPELGVLVALRRTEDLSQVRLAVWSIRERRIVSEIEVGSSNPYHLLARRGTREQVIVVLPDRLVIYRVPDLEIRGEVAAPKDRVFIRWPDVVGSTAIEPTLDGRAVFVLVARQEWPDQPSSVDRVRPARLDLENLRIDWPADFEEEQDPIRDSRDLVYWPDRDELLFVHSRAIERYEGRTGRHIGRVRYDWSRGVVPLPGGKAWLSFDRDDETPKRYDLERQEWADAPGSEPLYFNHICRVPSRGWVITGGELRGRIRVLDLEGNVVRELEGHWGAIRSLCASPDGRWLFSATSVGRSDWAVWDLETGQRIFWPEGEIREVSEIHFLPGGKRFLSRSVNSPGFLLWDVEEGRVVDTRYLDPPPDRVGITEETSLAFAPDGETCLVLDEYLEETAPSTARFTVRRAGTGEVVEEHTVPAEFGMKLIKYLDARRVVLAARAWEHIGLLDTVDWTYREWELPRDRDRHLPDISDVIPATGQALWSYPSSGHVEARRYEEGEWKLVTAIDGRPLQIDLPRASPDGASMVFIPYQHDGRPGRVEVFRLPSGELATAFPYPDHVLMTFFLSNDLVVACQNWPKRLGGRVEIRWLASGEIVRQLDYPHGGFYPAFAVEPGGRRFLTAANDGRIAEWWIPK